MFLQAALVGEAAAFGDVEHGEQRVVAARALQPGRVWRAHFVAVRVDQLEQLDDPAWADLVALELVEPDALAGEAEVEVDMAAVASWQLEVRHRLPAGRAGGGSNGHGRVLCGLI